MPNPPIQKSEADYPARLYPTPGQSYYIHLSDLSESIGTLASSESLTILDYGCGDSPYRPLFPNADYRRADLAGGEELDYIIVPDKRLDEQDGTFDLILSSQVLEHVRDPEAYFKECFRLLKPGGRLVATTHGSYPDHGGPEDYQRWTPWGMERDVVAAGFELEEIWRLTTGPRAVLQYWEVIMERTPASATSMTGLMVRLLRGLTRRFRAKVHRWSDEHWNSFRICKEEDFSHVHSIYIGLFFTSRKPE